MKRRWLATGIWGLAAVGLLAAGPKFTSTWSARAAADTSFTGRKVAAHRARPWFERAGVEGVVALRPISSETTRTHSPSVWTTTSYSTLWGYYGYGWTGVYSPGSVREDSVLVVETLIYSVPLDTLLWAGVSTTANPKEAQAFIKDLVAAAVSQMKKERLVK